MILLMLKPSSVAPALRLPLAPPPPNNCGRTNTRIHGAERVRNVIHCCTTCGDAGVITFLLRSLAACFVKSATCSTRQTLHETAWQIDWPHPEEQTQESCSYNQALMRALCAQHPPVPSRSHTLCRRARQAACCLLA